ncbi:hypothetical protein IV203_026974 [Nitzschia inconspicua]|uniref:Uncharacterized protein n=1 Tax=Nitzschia inconspicua TaxID=303405 RepID=A0A9K3PXT1_9STRA|nr:hypothetical protein IV203_026974 [Nitzschia inconspicua]
MAFNRLYKHIETLIRTDDEIADNIPCKADILSVRECRKDGKPCDDLGLELLRCMAQYKVDTTEKIRTTIGVAKYNEYVNAMVDKYGQEKADEIIAEPVEQLKDIEAYQVLHRVANHTNPKGMPKSAAELKQWSYVDQVRSEMGEQQWWDSVKIVGYEFGLDKADALFELTKERELIESAQDRLVPGMKEKRAQFLTGLHKIETSVKEAAPGAKSPADYAAALKDLYPTKEDLEAAFK